MRLFVAVNLPATERQAIAAASSALRGSDLPIRWVAEEGLHMTLKFLGEVAGERADEIGAALAAAVRHLKPFDVTLGGCGGFPSLDRPRVVWLGVERHPALELLANDVERALAPLGFDSELKPFQPHVTLGRARHGAAEPSLEPLANLAAGFEYEGVMVVENVDLMHSARQPDGSRYTLLSSAPLLGGAASGAAAADRS